MVFVLLKITLAVILSFVPILFVLYVKPKQKNNKECKNMFSFLKHRFPWLKKILFSMKIKAAQFNRRIKQSENCREFLIYIFFLLILSYQFVDFNASSQVARLIVGQGNSKEQIDTYIALYGNIISNPIATCCSGMFSFIFFNFRWSEKMILKIKESKRIFYILALLSVTLAITLPRYLIMSEIIFIIMIISYLYPSSDTIDYYSCQYWRRMCLRRELRLESLKKEGKEEEVDALIEDGMKAAKR